MGRGNCKYSEKGKEGGGHDMTMWGDSAMKILCSWEQINRS